jgi:glycine/serine hydroxymethyltransferase
MRSSVLTTIMRTTIFGLFGSTLIVASTANAATAGKHLTRHHKTYASETVRNANAFCPDPSNAFVQDQSAFGTVFRWPSGMQPDDWRQSVNGD